MSYAHRKTINAAFSTVLHLQEPRLTVCIIEVLTIRSSKRQEIELLYDFLPLLHPYDEHISYDYDKVYIDDESYRDGYND